MPTIEAKFLWQVRSELSPLKNDDLFGAKEVLNQKNPRKGTTNFHVGNELD